MKSVIIAAKPYLNIRQTPEMGGMLIGKAGYGTVIPAQQSGANNWLQVDWRGQLGYCSKRYTRSFWAHVWPTNNGTITQAFGNNPNYYRRFYNDNRGHQGVDFSTIVGSQVYNIAPGVVKMVYNKSRLPRSQGGHNFGYHVRVDHGNEFESIYCHLDETLAEVGQDVPAGFVVGLAGNTGNILSGSSHLHFAIKERGRYVNPDDYFGFLKWTQ